MQAKTTCDIQARVASFAAQRLITESEPSHVQRGLYRSLGNASMLQDRISEHEVLNDEYADFIREASDDELAIIDERKRLLEAFTDFEEPIDRLFGDFNSGDIYLMRLNHPCYVDAGSYSDVYKIEREGQSYAVKIPRVYHPRHPKDIDLYQSAQETVDHYVIAGLHGKGIPHLEQVTAVSYDKGVVVSEFMPGKTWLTITPNEVLAITDDHLRGLVDTLTAAEAAGVLLELQSSRNMLYDVNQGFGFIDYYSVDHPSKITAEPFRDHEKMFERIMQILYFGLHNQCEYDAAFEKLCARAHDIFADKGFFDQATDKV